MILTDLSFIESERQSLSNYLMLNFWRKGVTHLIKNNKCNMFMFIIVKLFDNLKQIGYILINTIINHYSN